MSQARDRRQRNDFEESQSHQSQFPRRRRRWPYILLLLLLLILVLPNVVTLMGLEQRAVNMLSLIHI